MGAAKATELTGIGSRLRAARERRGFSREALAFHSGLSWSAIAQVESGRRKNARPSTLSALSDALGVSIDYLVGGGAATPVMLKHQALLYESEEAFVDVAGSFLREGIERSEAMLAVTNKRNIEHLREHLGKDRERVEFADSEVFLQTPDVTLGAFRNFIGSGLDDGAGWIRIIGEPMWPERSESAVRIWTRFEASLNVLFGASPASMLCPYDVTALDPAIVDEARVTHPETVERGSVSDSADYRDPGTYLFEQ